MSYIFVLFLELLEDTISDSLLSGFLKLKTRRLIFRIALSFLEAILCCERVCQLTWVQRGPGVQHCGSQATANTNPQQQWGRHHI